MTLGKHLYPAVAALFLVAIFPLLPVPPFWVTLANNIGLASLVAIGLVLLTGVGGMTSFGQAAFCGFGAYTTAVLTSAYGFSPWLTLPLSLLVGAVVALPLGLMTVRLSGHYLPLGTIAWGLAIYYLFGRIELLGRYDGISGIPPLSLGGEALMSSSSIYYIIWIFVIAVAIGAENLLDSRVGRGIRALRGGSQAAEAFGVNIERAKLTVFVFAAVVAALSGWLYAHMQRSINPTPFGLDMGITYMLMAVVGGSGRVVGAIFGASVVLVLKEVLQRVLPGLLGTSVNFEMIVFGVLLVLILQLSRDGLWPLLERYLPARPPRTIRRDGEALDRRPMPQVGSPLVRVDRVRKAFGGLTAVNDVSFDIKAGQIIGLIGPNGAGKSTTFNLITGILNLSGGEVTYQGQRLSGLNPRLIARRGIARTFQHAKVLPTMSVLENVALGAHLRGNAGMFRSFFRLERGQERALLAEAADQLDRVGLGAHRDRPAGDLALGQIRILEIARALCLNPTLLLLDEPAAGLRHGEKQELADLLKKLRAEGVSVLLVEHDMGFVMGLVDHIVVLDFGTLIAEGKPADIRQHPAVIAAYLGGAA
ncbi:ABC transporter permease subunit [Agrobacterium fabrum]|uniref:Amino acid/amide ABC transporter membrane protein 2, HAAT family /amino acid/amide ABC transporter ATP-binding protein 1, HAAT family n=1 Tax=Agrobacterium fabrum TaxID=1176649 RepID=A0A7Z7FPJ1_9HYPH|nr:ATP-binding cassette domain-containing protein [Agrobacterium fabrum]WCK77359.1 ATP-binding cassette domain-containing protein [Agrobacterium fabrum]WIE28441.1 ATP-binding cassette domain-containing protein [Agrobacterium fabrum]WIE44399.1 ATP-binding cassette domain-containing protein [Agrobacterium fabrum]SDJ35389.1 amino acid/amide ABC transporter membrane protein 2, HAAT family /amino acid/amide ABC transporter ATP-binding protein 1, HAAT family [Agrobacterium fabrum]